MALQSACQIIVHLETFRNIDLLNQGLYQIEIIIYRYKNNKKQYANLSTFEGLSHKRDICLKFNPHRISEGCLIQGSHSARSRVFMIRYSDEQVRLDDISNFTIEIPTSEASKPLFIQANLLFSSISAEQCMAKDYSCFSNINLQKVNEVVFEISNPLEGVNEFLPIVYEKHWFCSVDGIIHVVFFDYKGKEPFYQMIEEMDPSNPWLGGEEINEVYNETICVMLEVYESLRLALIDQEELGNRGIRLPTLILPSRVGREPFETFADIIESHEKVVVASFMKKEADFISKNIIEAFVTLREEILEHPRGSFRLMEEKYEKSLVRRYRNFIVEEQKETLEIEDSLSMKRLNHKEGAQHIWTSAFHANIPKLIIEKEGLFPESNKHPIIYEETYQKELEDPPEETIRSLEIKSIKDIHLIVLVHGFQGSASDMKNLKNYISLVYPKCVFIESTYNELRTNDSIQEMGFRLAKEVVTFLCEVCSNETPIISFIGHSLGGVIIRAALPYLECFSENMHLFMSFASPHLGLSKSKALVNLGLWFLQIFGKSLSLKQMNLTDFEWKEGTFMYRLSQEPGLEWFKHVVLVGSSQDDYVPLEAARLEIPSSVRENDQNWDLYLKMIDNLTRKIELSKLTKFDVMFGLDTSFDSMIGRKAHLELIENTDFLKMLVYRFPEFFSEEEMFPAERRIDLVNEHISLDFRLKEVVICAAYRTPLTKTNKGAFKDLEVEEMLCELYEHLFRKTRLDPGKIEEVCIGNVLKRGANGMALRFAEFMAKMPESVPCYAVNRFCSSGLESCNLVANQVRSGFIDIGIAGGAENMNSKFDEPPEEMNYLPQWGLQTEEGPKFFLPMGVTSDILISRFNVSRERMDKMAYESNMKAAFSQENGLYDEEIVPIKVKGSKGEILVDKDDSIKNNTTIEKLAKLKPVFNKEGGTTAGNASQMTDGAAIVLLSSRKAAETNNLPILARWIGYAAIGVPPDIMGIGPLYAIPRVLEKTGLKIEDIDLFEINEAFASQASYCADELGIDPDKLNVKGGAIAIGHPYACTGTRMIATILPEMKRRKSRFAVLSMCIGTGMGAAAVIENLQF